MKSPEINDIRVSNNDNHKKIEKESKEKLDKLLRMKPKEYKNISKKEKEEIKRQFENEKTKKEVYEEEINNLENMIPLDYISILNNEIKEKLIGLCLNRKLNESFNEDGETMYEEDEVEDEEVDEDMELE